MKKQFSLLLLSLCCFCYVQATTLHVEQLYGAEFAMAVKEIGKLVINGTKLEFYNHQGEMLYTSDMSKMTAITFDAVSETSSDPNHLTDPSDPDAGDNEDPDNTEESDQALESIFAGDATKVVVYPNPTSTMLIVNGADAGVTLRLYSPDGRLMKTTVGATMNVEEVPNGNYLLQCENHIYKIIKQ